jgi:hypothetical protein
LCQRWGEENFTFFEDDPHSRKYNGRIQVRKNDYYTRFESWDAEHFVVQYHNSMTLLERGLKMNDQDFAALQTDLGISVAEFMDALKDEIGHCKPSSATPEERPPKLGTESRTSASRKRLPASVKASTTTRSNHRQKHTSTRTAAQRMHARAPDTPSNSGIKNQLARPTTTCGDGRVIKDIQESQQHPTKLSAASLAQPREKRGHSEVDDSLVQDNLFFDNKQKLNGHSPKKRARMQEPDKTSSLALTPQRSRITTKRRFCNPEMYGQGLKENQHKFADEEAIRQDDLRTMFIKLETAAKSSARNDEDGNIRLRTALSFLFNLVQWKYPTDEKITDFQNVSASRFYWLIYNSFIKSIGMLDRLVLCAIIDLREMADEGILGKEQELVGMREILQHVYRRFHSKWQEMVTHTIAAASNLS